jgi:hypothetical protein
VAERGRALRLVAVGEAAGEDADGRRGERRVMTSVSVSDYALPLSAMGESIS